MVAAGNTSALEVDGLAVNGLLDVVEGEGGLGAVDGLIHNVSFLYRLLDFGICLNP